nr:transposase [Parashewanella hymeniacidonis]
MLDQVTCFTKNKRGLVNGYVVIVDGAAWHQETVADEFENLTLVKLPPYSPELNPIEQVWQWMRQNELANRCFSGYENIVNECSRAWNTFRSDIKNVQSLCKREWFTMGI